ncbi:MAG: XdhC family protein [Gemmatimonadetes bacterium]|nr:XdhC family protein [Gemmatimonadota bacterium]
MTEMLEQLDEFAGRERRVAMATLVATRGASPRREGAKMWVGEGGGILGSVTIGGCVDARVVQESAETLGSGRPRLLSVELGEEDAREMGLSCAGSVDVFLEPLALDDPADPTVAAYARVRAHTAAGGRAVIATPLRAGGGKLVVLDDGAVSGDVGDPALVAEIARLAADVIRRGSSRTVEVAGVPVFFEVHAPPHELVVFGAGHIAQQLVRFARALGMRTVVVDSRDRYANRDAFPDADEIRVGIPSEVAETLRFGPLSAVVLVAHDYKFDLPVLRRVLATDAAYVGMLGSRKRADTILRMLAEGGVAPEALARVRTPIGLDLGAETAAELAISIIAEILAERAGRPGTPMRLKGRA